MEKMVQVYGESNESGKTLLNLVLLMIGKRERPLLREVDQLEAKVRMMM